MYKTQNIVLGAAAIYVSVKDSTDATFYGVNGDVAVAVPTGVKTGGAPAQPLFEADTTNWRALGYTSDGIEFSYEPDYGEVNIDQSLDAVKLFKQGMSSSVKTTLSEATLKNLVLAWGQRSASLTTASTIDTLDIAGGALYDEPIERSLAFIGPAPRNPTTNKRRDRVYHLRRALNVESSAHSLSKTDPTNIPVSLRVLGDPYFTGKEYGNIYDRDVE